MTLDTAAIALYGLSTMGSFCQRCMLYEVEGVVAVPEVTVGAVARDEV